MLFIKKFFFLMLGVLGLFLSGCKKLVDVNPPITTLTQDAVSSNDGTAIAAVTGVYASLSNGSPAIPSLFAGLSADELTLYPGSSNTALNEYYTNSLSSSVAGMEYWQSAYNLLYTVNTAIGSLQNNTVLTSAIRTQLLGECQFTWAFLYFYLVNEYGPVPILTQSDYKVNESTGRNTVDSVYAAIVDHLQNAISNLSGDFLDGTLLNTTTERTRPTKWAAEALLARTYLYQGNYAMAEQQATNVINAGLFSLVDSLNAVFLANSNEAIWQLQPVSVYFNSPEAQIFIIPPTGPVDGSVYLSDTLLASFENNDKRRYDWVDSVVSNSTTYYFPYKYRVYLFDAPITEYTMALRLSEQLLIRAEARAQQQNTSGAADDLNAVRTRAGLAATSATNQADLLTAIYHERQIELFTEWGQRWFDLKRTGLVNTVLGAPGNICHQKGGTWNEDWVLYPLPLSDLQADRALTQNAGY